MIPIVIDIEASGFGSGSYPIEIGVIDEHGQRYCSLIKPLLQWTSWDATAFEVHGISRAYLESHGKPAVVVAQELNNLLNGKRVFSDGWVADQLWLNTLFQSVGLWPSFTLSPIEGIQTPLQHECWDETLSRLRRKHNEQRHRASSDAYLIQLAYITSAK
ncbi:MAG TPA: hypothetical protein VIZ65_09945 [Cellvibrionaceae bacterium]